MSSDQKVKVNIDEDRIGRAAGKASGKEIKSQLRSLENQISETTNAVRDLQTRIEGLERRISEVEVTKARAQRQAAAELKETLEQQVQEKREEYERRVGEVLDDYRASIERLKNRFVNSISGQGEQFESVEEEFEQVTEAREAVVKRSETFPSGPTSTYRDRMNSVVQSRNQFLESIDAFLEDREDTASTIESLQTDVSGISGQATVTVPFWVVGVEKGGTEEIRVYPVLNRTKPSESPTRAEPYSDHLAPHPTHGHTDMVDAVQSYVVRDDVRDALANQDDGAYADPGVLEREGVAKERFVKALREFELGSDTSEDEITPSATEGTQEVAADD